MASSLLAVALFGMGCALDARSLEPAADGGADGTDGGGGSPGSAGSHSGGPNAGAPLNLPECSYSGTIQAGCETIVNNAGFGDGIAGWEPDPLAISIDWQAGVDADGNEASGSIEVINRMHGTALGIAPGGGRQCVAARAGNVFDMAGDVFIAEGQGDGLPGGPYAGSAGLSIQFWPTEGCSDEMGSLQSFQSELVDDVETWKHVEGTSTAPERTRSMSVRLLTVKVFRQYAFKARFDNVFVRQRP